MRFFHVCNDTGEICKSYYEYMNSQHWQNIRRKYFQTNKNVCYVCESKMGLQLHHRSYKRLGNERMTDLILLCPDCHQTLHLRMKKDKKLKLWSAARMLKYERWWDDVDKVSKK